MTMKRYGGGDLEDKNDSELNYTTCLMLLSKFADEKKIESVHDHDMDAVVAAVVAADDRAHDGCRWFACKTCDKKFSSFQALGGHRASHRKDHLQGAAAVPAAVKQPKTHECPICGVEFAMGQALGGHMRRHRGLNPTAVVAMKKSAAAATTKDKAEVTTWVDLDLNLTPLENYDLRLQLGNAAGHM